MTNANATTYYAEYFKSWQKHYGPKPSADQLQVFHDLQLKPGKQALACAMALRDCGATNPQMMQAVKGGAQLNRMRGLILDKYVKHVPAPRDEHNHTVYKLELTEKGKAYIDRMRKRDAEAEAAGAEVGANKPAKAKAKAKAKPAKRTGKPAKAAKAVTAPAIAVDDNGNTVAISPSAALLPDNVLVESAHNDIDAGTFTDETSTDVTE